MEEISGSEMFNNILDQDEQIIKVFKPNKCKMYFSTLLLSVLSLLLFFIVACLYVMFPDEGVVGNPIYLLIPVGVYLLILLIIWGLTAIAYKNLFYAYSNKRIIIRSGIFGVDFKSLDMSMIGAVNVYVSLLDKILNKNTGSLSFGSTASPMVYGKSASMYNFSHIVMPYETCKEIKFFIDEFKRKQKEEK